MTTRTSPRTPDRRSAGRGFWLVAFAFAAVLAFAAVPNPLYVIYAARDGWSSFTITLVFAAYAIGVTGSLFLVGHVSDWYGRRRVLVPAVALSVLSAIVFLLSTDLAALVLARVLSGISVGAVTATATAYLAELHARNRPTASPARAQLVAIAANLGGIGIGPLVSGALAQWVGSPLVVPYVASLVALLLAAVAVAATPETRETPEPRPRYRPQRVAVPGAARGRFVAAALGALLAFSTFGLFSGLTGTILSDAMHHDSRALAGAAIFAVFAAAAVAQATIRTWSVQRTLELGMTSIVGGLLLVVASVWLPTPSLALFLAGGVVTGAGAGALLKGTLGTVVEIATDDGRAEALAGLFLAGYVGISVPVVGVGLTLQVASTKTTLLGFALVVAVAIVAAARPLVGRADADPEPGASV